MTHHTKPEPETQPVARCEVGTEKIQSGEDHVKVEHGGAYHTVCCVSCAARSEASPDQYSATM